MFKRSICGQSWKPISRKGGVISGILFLFLCFSKSRAKDTMGGKLWIESLIQLFPYSFFFFTELNWFKLGHFSLMIENQGAFSYLLFTWQIYTNESIATSKGNMRIQFWDQLNLALYQMNKCSADKKTKYYGHNLSKITTQFLSTKCIWWNERSIL